MPDPLPIPPVPQPPQPPQPFYHPDSGAVRCWVPLPDGSHIGAIVRRALLHHCFQGTLDDDGNGALACFAAHRTEIEAAVRARAARGSIEPVLLRESDFPAPPQPRPLPWLLR